MTFTYRGLLFVVFAMLPLLSAKAQTDAAFEKFASRKELGCIIHDGRTTFRIFAPRATAVTLVLFSRYDDDKGEETPMVRDTDGVWEHTADRVLYGKFYGYRVSGPGGKGEMFSPGITIGDPYSRAVATKNAYRQPAKTLILDTSYDWEGDTFRIPADHTRLIIYEAHLRDLTAHPSSGARSPGTYAGFLEREARGGLSHIKALGVNAVEFLPLMKFGTIEFPYRDTSYRTEAGEYNTWNPYERNHWGYMTSYFFAPETYYATDGTLQGGLSSGTDGRVVKELKDVVKALHREGIACILDVVYNHVSQYDYNPFKYIDKFYYFHTDAGGEFLKSSGCGNDFRTDRPMARRLIVESVTYWMKEYHIDGFRFDLAAMIDWETCRQIAIAAKSINPDVILIAEPWGGGKYEPPGFSDIGWASWNDRFRNGVKGQNPADGLGFIFGKFQGSNSKKSVMSYVTGTLRSDGGMYLRKEESVNYLESHDDNTLGDFIRLGTREVKEVDSIADVDKNAVLSERQLALNKLAAVFLMTSQGPVMLHEGQEYARSKVIAPGSAPDPMIGRIDHNSYNKDNATNYLNYRHCDLNKELFEYYQGLIALRRRHPLFGSAPAGAVRFIKTGDDFLIAYKLNDRFMVILNGNPSKLNTVKLPRGKWDIIANREKVSPERPIGAVTGSVAVPPSSGMILALHHAD
jgi:pullulanase